MRPRQQISVCIEQQCNRNRFIANWEQLCSHFELQHEVLPLEKFEQITNQKLNTQNQESQSALENQLKEIINQAQDQVILKVKNFFAQILTFYSNQFLQKIKISEQLGQLVASNESLLKQYLAVYYGSKISSSVQTQADQFFKELTSRVLYAQNDLNKSFAMLLQLSTTDIAIKPYNELVEIDTPQAKDEIVKDYAKPQHVYEYKYEVKKMDIAYKDEDIQQQNQQQQQYQYQQQQQQQEQFYYQQQQNIKSLQQQNLQSQQQPQQLPQQPNNPLPAQQKQIPLRGYKQAEQQQSLQQQELQTNQFQPQPISDRIIFSLPSDSEQLKYVPNKQQQEDQFIPKQIVESENEKQQLQLNQNRNVTITGKKFDITNSDKHLKYGQRFSIFQCKQFGFAVVAGSFSLDEDAKVKFSFSDPNGEYDAEMGIIEANFDRAMIRKNNQGKIFLDESGAIYKNEKKRISSIKIEMNYHYQLHYRSEKRLLMFRRQDIAEYIHLDASMNGTYRFYVALSNLQVQIL